MEVSKRDVGWSCDVVFPGSPTHHSVQVPAEEDEEVVVLPSNGSSALAKNETRHKGGKGEGNGNDDGEGDMEGLSDAGDDSDSAADRDATVAAAEAAAAADAAAAEAAVAAAKAAATKAAASKAAEKAAEKAAAAAAAAKPSTALPKKRPAADPEASSRNSASSVSRDGDGQRVTQRGRIEGPSLSSASSTSTSASGPPSSTSSAATSRAPPSLEAAPWSSSSSHGLQQRAAAVASQRPPSNPPSAKERSKRSGGDDSSSSSGQSRRPSMPSPSLPAMVPARSGSAAGVERPRKQSELMAETLTSLKNNFATKWRPLLKELEVRKACLLISEIVRVFCSSCSECHFPVSREKKIRSIRNSVSAYVPLL